MDKYILEGVLQKFETKTVNRPEYIKVWEKEIERYENRMIRKKRNKIIDKILKLS